jgi:ADP-ribosyl-[dinitrogen reductase] hydrolase
MSNPAELRERFVGPLIGTAVGDSLGLPAEGLSKQRIEQRWRGQWRHRFIFGHGMWSDDTEHTIFVAQALLTQPDNVVAFQRCLAWKLRLWLLGLPAGVGLATLRSILKLWVGVPVERSGVFSAGNAPSMRSAIIGAYFYEDPQRRRSFVSASTRLTHSDPKAETAAMAVAEAAAWALEGKGSKIDLLLKFRQLGIDEEWSAICSKLEKALAAGDSVSRFADSLGLTEGVSGYSYHSVPIALYAWLRSPSDYREALTSALNCGGDTDTVGAIVGALAGASVGVENIPADWRIGLVEWPRSVGLLGEIGRRLADQKCGRHGAGPAKYFWPGLALRNLLFLVAVLVHGFRRLLP